MLAGLTPCSLAVGSRRAASVFSGSPEFRASLISAIAMTPTQGTWEFDVLNNRNIQWNIYL